ncbi:glycosyltransferase family 4 protein [Mucilaginibacter ginsenosidivorax]|uniref:Glycosyltransferase family 4 protein n=1 Tax=Mucilaginibacter ginsenosidivorax TaxID=862126 RepID=A0A5B8VT22_9SPHI|nr:glycosyltransferase family 1 protein [Mucilaginibacter ginsenosidivorax]QEC74794.1 glycosyltransferase family 4 protein [Mucilaginibacter ginsenosidivorax]
MDIIINARFLTQKLTGVQRFAIEIAKQLKVLIPMVRFVAPSNIIHHHLAEEFDVLIIGKRRGVVWEQIDLPIFLKKNGNPFLVNLCNAAPIFYGNQAITLHDVAFLVNPDWFNKNFVRFYKFLIPRIAKKARIVFTVSDFSKSEIVKYIGINPLKIKVIYNGISDLSTPIYTAEAYGNYILTVGSIEKRKNILTLIEAFNEMPNEGIKLVIVGDVSPIFNNQGNEMMKTNGNVVFAGRVDDAHLAGLYTNAQMFIYPSLYEGFGIPPLEAMAYGCPTIVSDIDSLKEVCAEASLYINPQSSKSISEGIMLLKNDEVLRNNFIVKGKRNIARFSWQLSARLIVDSITSLSD